MQDRLFCPRCGTTLLPRAEKCHACGVVLIPLVPDAEPTRTGGPPLVAIGASLLVVCFAAIAALAVVTLMPPSAGAPLAAVGSAPIATSAGSRPSATVRAPRSPTPSVTQPSAPTIDPTLAARLDGNPWYIQHEVTSSTRDDAEPGDLLARIYTVDYRCSSPPCDATISSDDPDTISPATDNPFAFRDGAYVSTETYRDRCVTASGQVYRRAYVVELITTIRVTAAEKQESGLSATAIEGSQVRAAAASGVPTDACPDWRIDYRTTGSRNVRPGLATDFVSSNWAGYVAEPRDGRVTHVEGSWQQPAILCPDGRSRFAAFWIGIDGFRTETVQQLGTVARCTFGQPQYAAWWEMYPDPSVPWEMAVRPGDEFHATIDAAGGDFTMTLQNLTTDETRTTTQSGSGLEQASAEWIAEPPYVCSAGGCELAVLSDFGRVRFDDALASIDGGPPIAMTDDAWRLARNNIETAAGYRAAETSTLSSDGTSFTVNWRPSR